MRSRSLLHECVASKTVRNSQRPRPGDSLGLDVKTGPENLTVATCHLARDSTSVPLYRSPCLDLQINTHVRYRSTICHDWPCPADQLRASRRRLVTLFGRPLRAHNNDQQVRRVLCLIHSDDDGGCGCDCSSGGGSVHKTYHSILMQFIQL